ncbi:hypothetical protein ZHAS_00010755 [Anopheles sinensis]|uniref:Uncharacterized protein n=1 Tax=Anopheles sinensis TaxID=74873 RepID=A0A084VYN1_ANOSI|nr:hypothetical protein ZHAS_00010755 [Anopheles sinensis]
MNMLVYNSKQEHPLGFPPFPHFPRTALQERTKISLSSATSRISLRENGKTNLWNLSADYRGGRIRLEPSLHSRHREVQHRGPIVSDVLLMTLALVVRTDALPVSSFLGDDGDYADSYEDNDYDVVFDQRQNGTANVHLSVDGVLLALPAPEIPSSASLAGATLLELFASQLAAGGGDSEDDTSDELYTGGSESSTAGTSSSTSSSSTSTTTSTTTTAAPALAPAAGGLSSDFAFETLPASLLGQGLNFLFNTRRGEIPFRLSPGGDPGAKPMIPLLITKVEKAPGRHDLDDSHEDSHEVAEPQRVAQQEHSGKKKRKHKRKLTCGKRCRHVRPRLMLNPKSDKLEIE